MLHGENPALRAPRSFPFLSKKEMGAYSPNPGLASAHFRIFREKSAVTERAIAQFTWSRSRFGAIRFRLREAVA